MEASSAYKTDKIRWNVCKFRLVEIICFQLSEKITYRINRNLENVCNFRGEKINSCKAKQKFTYIISKNSKSVCNNKKKSNFPHQFNLYQPRQSLKPNILIFKYFHINGVSL